MSFSPPANTSIATFLILDVSIEAVTEWAIHRIARTEMVHACFALFNQGWTAGLPVAIALWVVWRRGKWLPRLGVGFALLAVVEISEFIIGRGDEVHYLLNPFSVQWTLLLAAVAVLLPVRDWSGWRLQSADDAPPTRRSISLLQLFQWMTVLAVALAMWRAAHAISLHLNSVILKYWVEHILPRCFLTLPPACVALYAVLATKSSAVSRCAVFSGLAVSYAYYFLVHYRLDDLGYWPGVLYMTGLTAAALVYALILRIAGLRLIQPVENVKDDTFYFAKGPGLE